MQFGIQGGRRYVGKLCSPPLLGVVSDYVVLKASVFACNRLRFCKKRIKYNMNEKENIEAKFLIYKSGDLLLARRSQRLRRARGRGDREIKTSS